MQVQTVARLRGPREIGPEQIELPTCGPDDIILGVVACGICGTDLSMYKEGPSLPGAILGHEFVGRIDQVGGNIGSLTVGQRVVVNPMHNGLGLGRTPGAFARQVRVTKPVLDESIFALPDELDDDQGALVEPFSVALHAINNGRVDASDRAVVFGAGTIGLCVVAGLRARGVQDILVIDPSELRRNIATKLGASAVLDPRDGDAIEFIADHFGQDTLSFGGDLRLSKATVAFDCAGARIVPKQAIHALAPRGRLVLVADPHDIPLDDLRLVMLRELTVVGALAYDLEFSEAITLLASRAVDLKPLITHRFALTDIAKAFEVQLDASASIKVIIDPVPG
jgi:2-desacetyl-2-hydroxyethyl bacteriochlorophyllide A dehydrogenase